MKEVENHRCEQIQVQAPAVAEDEAQLTQDAEENQPGDDDGDWFARMQEELAAEEPAVAAPALDSVDAVCLAELNRYITTPSLALGKMVDNEPVFNDPLEWWKQHQTMFPNLVKLAVLYLPIQATSAPSERIFSMAKLLISDKRNRLGTEIAEKILYVQQQWKEGINVNLKRAVNMRAAEAEAEEEEEDC